MEQSSSSHGMRAFFTIWFGQLISLVGSQLTGFALGVWVYDQTRSVLLLAIVQVALQAPYVLLSPLAGVFADRWNRRTAMMVSDAGAGLALPGGSRGRRRKGGGDRDGRRGGGARGHRHDALPDRVDLQGVRVADGAPDAAGGAAVARVRAAAGPDWMWAIPSSIASPGLRAMSAAMW